MSSAVLDSSKRISAGTYENGEFDTVVFTVKRDEDFWADISEDWTTGNSRGYAEHSFVSTDLMWRVLSGKRWEILTVMAGVGELSIREVARKVARDVKAVHGDVTALMKAGVIKRGESGKVVFPYHNFHLSLSNQQAAA